MKKTIILMALCSLFVAVLPGVACASESEAITVGQHDLYPIDFKDIPNNIVPIEVNTFEEAEEILDLVAQSMTMDCKWWMNKIVHYNQPNQDILVKGI